MEVDIPKGRYVLAVSGGVDSMVLLDILARRPELRLVAAHFNHGIRSDASKDEKHVKEAAKRYKLPFETGHGRLGPRTSEERARQARYEFLNSVKGKYQADGIITAHHQDDLIETAFINLLRGSGRRGLTAISHNPDILRPLLDLPKIEILAYAKDKGLEWLEDSTNQDESYLRNYVRHQIVAKMTKDQRQKLLLGLDRMSDMNRVLNQEIEILSQIVTKGNKIERSKFISLPPEVADEVMMHYLRNNEAGGFEQKTIERMTMAVKTAKAGTKHDITKGKALRLTDTEALLITTVSA